MTGLNIICHRTERNIGRAPKRTASRLQEIRINPFTTNTMHTNKSKRITRNISWQSIWMFKQISFFLKTCLQHIFNTTDSDNFNTEGPIKLTPPSTIGIQAGLMAPFCFLKNEDFSWRKKNKCLWNPYALDRCMCRMYLFIYFLLLCGNSMTWGSRLGWSQHKRLNNAMGGLKKIKKNKNTTL